MSGLIPAMPLIVIRPFLPESPVWAQKRAAGTLHRPSVAELFSPKFRRTTIVTTIMFACSYGAAFGAIQQIPQIVPGVPDVAAATADKPVPAQKAIRIRRPPSSARCRKSADWSAASAWQSWRCASSAVASLLRIFQIPGLIVAVAGHFCLCSAA